MEQLFGLLIDPSRDGRKNLPNRHQVSQSSTVRLFLHLALASFVRRHATRSPG